MIPDYPTFDKFVMVIFLVVFAVMGVVVVLGMLSTCVKLIIDAAFGLFGYPPPF